MWVQEIEIGGFSILVMSDGIVVDPSQEISSEYIKAIKKAHSNFKYYKAVSNLKGWGVDPRDVDTGSLILLVCEGIKKRILSSNDDNLNEIIDRFYNPKKYIQQPKPKQPKPSTIGYVYLIRSSDGFYKIGKSKVPMSRISTLEVKLPFPVEPIHITKQCDYTSLEQSLHLKFQSKRVNGEWFNLSEEDIEYIKGL